MKFDYRNLNLVLLGRAKSLVPNWIPGGHVDGSEYVVKNPTRQDKTAGSFRINLRSGQWADFATGDKGGDLISLYAYVNRIKNSDAARELSVSV